MALITKSNPEGVDVVIDQLQKDLYQALIALGWLEYESYHRAYRNKKGSDLLPEVYVGGKDYKDVLFDDTKIVTSFFLAEEERDFDSVSSTFTQGISVIFQARLNKLFPAIQHRADEELIAQVIKVIKSRGWDNKLLNVITGFEKVYKSLKISDPRAPFDDMSNFNIARFYFDAVYTVTSCQTSIIK